MVYYNHDQERQQRSKELKMALGTNYGSSSHKKEMLIAWGMKQVMTRKSSEVRADIYRMMKKTTAEVQAFVKGDAK